MNFIVLRKLCDLRSDELGGGWEVQEVVVFK